MQTIRVIALAASCSLATAALPAIAQVVHVPAYPFNGDSASDNFGYSVHSAGDVNNDGFDDLIVGAPFDDNNGADSGSARVFSGADGSILYTFNGDSANDLFGFSVSGAGDVNNDGFDDLIVGAPLDDNVGTSTGSARVFSGANGAILYTFTGNPSGSSFGFSVSGAGDVNNDGFDDLIVGSQYNGAQVFSGLTGAILHIFFGDSPGDEFGESVSGAGDVNGDGFDDLIIGANLDDNNGADSGSARVFSGADGSILYTFNGDSANDLFGFSVSGAGDVNNDGFDDLIVGAIYDDNNGSDSGSARVLSGSDGSILHAFNGDSAEDRFGFSVSGAGDVNGDGFADLIVGANLDDNNGGNSGSARVLSGSDGSVLYTFNGDAAGDWFGFTVSGAGDVNNDGYDDLIAGAASNDGNGLQAGRARVFYSVPQPSPVCPGNANGDAIVSFDDINAVISNFNSVCALGAGPSLLTPAYPFRGSSASDEFGVSVHGAGDVNNDGFDDLIVGARSDDDNGSISGSARVYSGFNGQELYAWNGDSAGDSFGFAVSAAGDVNNDGFADLIVGAYLDDNNGSGSGIARVFSGADGAILYTFTGDSAGDSLGYSVSGAGDVNNDGFDDLIVGAFGDDNNGSGSGSARVFSGINGSLLYTFVGDSAGDQLGFSVCGAGDVNNDGFDDLIAGAIADDNNGADSGSARVFSGLNGGILHTFFGDSANDIFGASVSGAGDVNNDGFADLIVGARNDDNNGSDSGSARVFSGADGSILYTFNGDSAGDQLGFSVSGAGDVDADGHDDLIVGAWLDDNNGSASGSARVFSGADGSILYTFNGDSDNDAFGFSVSGGRDVNNDGFADLIVGAPSANGAGVITGSARVFYTVPQPALVCPGNANGDSNVNFDDITAVIANWLNMCP